MNKKLMFGIVLFLLVITPNVLALGITPGRTTINFEPNLHKEVDITIINDEHKDMNVMLRVEGELSEVITLNRVLLNFNADEDSKTFTYKIDLLKTIEKPGTHEVKIIAMELPKDFEKEGGYVGATVAVVTQLHIKVPYPGKYAEIKREYSF